MDERFEQRGERGEHEEKAPRSLEERVEGWIRVMLRETMLGPLLAVMIGHVVAFLVPVIVLATRDRSLFAMAGLSILLVVSGGRVYSDFRQYRRPGPIGGSLLVIWSLAGAASAAAVYYGIF